MTKGDTINPRLIATDLDGTLLNDSKTVSATDLCTLEKLGQLGIVRVAATGRSMHKVVEVLNSKAPFDYIVFSSGSGIYDWKEQKLLVSEWFTQAQTRQIIDHLLDKGLNFLVFQPIPRNNKFVYHRGAGACNEFDQYIARHQSDCAPLNRDNLPKKAGQVMCILPNNENHFETVRCEVMQACKRIKVIRTTSPVNGNFIWMEIFPDTVSKGHGLKWLCNKLEITASDTIALGNDFNDLDMLEFTAHPWIVSNASQGLKSRYAILPQSNNDHPLTGLWEKAILF